jgi:hypothetical protein
MKHASSPGFHAAVPACRLTLPYPEIPIPEGSQRDATLGLPPPLRERGSHPPYCRREYMNLQNREFQHVCKT